MFPNIPKFLNLSPCKYCFIAKMKKSTSHKNRNKSKINKHINRRIANTGNTKLYNFQYTKHLDIYQKFRPGEFICIDLKHMPESLHGEKYLCTFTCVGTRKIYTKYLKTKDSFKMEYNDYINFVTNKTGFPPKYVHTDNGGEFVNNCVSEINRKHGITHTFTSPYSSVQNPIAERVNRTITEGSLAMLLFACLPLTFWTFSVSTFTYIKNRSPHVYLKMSNPLAEWNIFESNRAGIELNDIRCFGCEAYVLDEQRLKSHPKAFRCIYLGPSSTHKGSVFYNIFTKKIIISRNFILNEDCYPGRSLFTGIYDRYMDRDEEKIISSNQNENKRMFSLHQNDGKEMYYLPSTSQGDDVNVSPDHHVLPTSQGDDNVSPDNILFEDDGKEMYHLPPTSQGDDNVSPEYHVPPQRDDNVSPDSVPFTPSKSLHTSNNLSSINESAQDNDDIPEDENFLSHIQGHRGDHSPDTKDHFSVCKDETHFFIRHPSGAEITPLSTSQDSDSDDNFLSSDMGHYEVDSILKMRKTRFKGDNQSTNGYDFQILWKPDHNGIQETTWVPSQCLVACEEAIDKFVKSKNFPSSYGGKLPDDCIFPSQDDSKNNNSGVSTNELLTTPTSSTNATSTSSSFTPDSEAQNNPKHDSVLANISKLLFLPIVCYLTGLKPDTTVSLTKAAEWKNIKIPKNRDEMLRSPEREQWLAAEREELDSLIERNTWTRVSNARKQPITVTWVYKLKPPSSVQPYPRFKVRLCAHGFKQKFGEDYSSTFARVATFKAFRILIWVASFLGMRSTQLDIKTAFLYGNIDSEIYLCPPPGHPEIGIVKLNKTIYGLKQSPRIWMETLTYTLNTLGFKPLISDSCVFKHVSTQFYVLVFVDDIIICGADEKFRKFVVNSLKEVYTLRDMGDVSHFLGLQLTKDKHNNIIIHQSNYIEKLCDTFDDNDCTNSLPYTPSSTFDFSQQPTNETDQKEMKKYPYRQLIGSLLYTLVTRPELYFIIITLSKFSSNPGLIHFTTALSILRYLKRTVNLGIRIPAKDELIVSAYCDSDWASDKDSRRSISGYIIYLGKFPVIWRARQQKGKSAAEKAPSASSCEAEYRSLNDVLAEIIWLINFLKELGLSVPTPITIKTDSKSAIDLAHNPINHDRTKHIDIRFHRIREYLLDGTIIIEFIPGEENPADLFTKCVTTNTFKYLLSFIYPSL